MSVASTSTEPLIVRLDRSANRLWNAFKTVQFGIFLLATIGAVAIYGTMFYAANDSLGDQGIPLAKARVFNAWWFFGLLALFFVQFIVSTWHVTKMSFGIWKKADFGRSRGYITGPGEGRASLEIPGGRAHVEQVLTKNFTRWHKRGDKYFAHAGLRQRIGPTIIHTGIVVIILAGLVHLVLDRQGYILSEGRYLAAEGETTSQIYTPIHLDHQINPQGNMAPIAIPFDVKLLDFDEIKHPNSSSPAYFSSLLEVRDHETGQVRVAKLDMNHSLRIGAHEFHQAGFQQLPPTEGVRTDFKVRDARTGESLGVTDATPETRVQVEDLDLFLEVDGVEPGDPWRMYTAQSPNEPIASGVLLRPAVRGTFSYRVKEFYPDFHFTEELGAYSRSPYPDNPAAVVEVIHAGDSVAETVLFLNPALQEFVPKVDRNFDLELIDVRVRGVEEHEEFENFDWTRRDVVRLEIATRHHETGEELGTQLLPVGATSEPIRFTAEGLGDEQPPAGAQFAVYPVGTSPRYITILSVTREPMTDYYTLGVALLFFGALLTFSGRYRALYGYWDEAEGRFHLALVPRFGKKPDPAEFKRLLEALTAGAPQPIGNARLQPRTAKETTLSEASQ